MYLLGNGRLVTRDDANPYLENGCVAIEGNLIKEVGETAALKAKYPEAEFIDAKGGVIMPGFINAHNHIYSAFARGLTIKGNNPTTVLEVLDQQWWTIDRNLLLPDTKASADATYLDCIMNGVTTIFDHHASYGGIEGSLFAIAESAKEFGVRSNLCYEISDRDGEDKMKASVKENVDFIKYAQADTTDMIKGMMGMHAPFTLSNKTLEYCAAEKPEGAGYHIHVAEGIDDLYDSLTKYNKRLVFRSDKKGSGLWKEIGLFFSARVLGWVIFDIALFNLCLALLKNTLADADLWVKLLMNVLVVIFNYLASKFVIFRK